MGWASLQLGVSPPGEGPWTGWIGYGKGLVWRVHCMGWANVPSGELALSRWGAHGLAGLAVARGALLAEEQGEEASGLRVCWAAAGPKKGSKFGGSLCGVNLGA